MSLHLGIRTRLTVIVTLLFGVAIAVGSAVVVDYIHGRLLANARDNAASLLTDYLDSATAGGPVVATIDPNESGVFFYRDADGNRLTQNEYLEMLRSMAPADADGDPESTEPQLEETLPPEGSQEAPEVGEQTVTISISATRVGGMEDVDLGDDTVAVLQRVRFIDGTELQIGVSSPLQPVTESVEAINTVLWIALPVLVVVVGLLTYQTVGRTLRPVHSITQQTREISDTNLAKRVPVPATKDDVAELATTMNEMLSRLDHAQQRQRQFIADASHELRSPIAASQSQLEVALAHPDSTDWPITANHVLNEQTQLGHLVDDLLALSRLDEQGLGPVAPVQLGELVQQEVARPHRSAIDTDVDDDVWIRGSRTHLAGAIRNIIDNADRHAATTVNVTVSQDSGQPTIHVDDDGPGVPVDQRQQIFERFTLLDEPRNRTDGGAGLGLAIVKEVVQAHGGTVECADGPLGGARITLRFPDGAP